jgi:hypothetical protein
MIRLDDLEAKAKAAIPTRLPAEATMESVGEERKYLHTTRWDEIKEALKEIAE